MRRKMSLLCKPKISVIIPTLNEGLTIGATIDAVRHLSVPIEVIVVDGGSDDNTCEIATERGAQVIASERGRGAQMHRGAGVAQADVLWFLHADTIVPPNGPDLIVEAIQNIRVVAGNFDVRFHGRGAASRFMTWLYPQLRWFELCYGDSAIFVRREAYEQIGGFKPLPIFEDLDLLRSLRKIGRFVHLSATVVTSSRRFEGRSFIITLLRWILMQLLYWLG